MASAAEQLAANINFASIGKAQELKKRIWFTLGALMVYRLGTYIPLPGIDPAAFASVDWRLVSGGAPVTVRGLLGRAHAPARLRGPGTLASDSRR